MCVDLVSPDYLGLEIIKILFCLLLHSYIILLYASLRIPRLLGFKNYLNNCFAYCCTFILFAYMRGSVDLISPGYLGSKLFN